MGSFSSTPSNSGGTPINKPASTLTTMHVIPANQTPAKNICFQFDIPDDQLKIAEPALSKSEGMGTPLSKGSCTSIGYTSRYRNHEVTIAGMTATIRAEEFKLGEATNAVKST